MHRHRSRFIAAFSALVLAACTQTTGVLPSGSDGDLSLGAALSLTQFTDIAVPGGATLDLDRSLILGPHDVWTGRVRLESSQTPADLYAFHRSEMPSFGWTEISVARGKVSLLTYLRDGRVATIEIARSKISGAAVTITMAPTTTQIQVP